MKHISPFVISEFTNPSGEIVYRVYARIDGQRFRKNFATRAEAEAERQIQEVQWLQGDTGTRAAITRSALKAGTGQRRPNSCDLKSSATW